MKRWIAAAAILGWATVASAAAPQPLTSLRAIHALTNPEASHLLPVAFEATVTYWRPYEETMFVQDGDVAIYVEAKTRAPFVPGDRVLIRGTTQPSFRPYVLSDNITFLHHGPVPKPALADFDHLIRGDFDCEFVTVHARVRTADMIVSTDVPNISLQMNSAGGEIDAVVDSNDASATRRLLDADVEVTGAVSGRFDGKMQQTGILLHISSLADVRIVRQARADPWSLPVTPMDRILSSYHVDDLAQRIRVHGTITYYQPGSMLVLQDGDRSLWIQTQTRTPLHIGNKADAIGFPAVQNGFLTLSASEIQERPSYEPARPLKEDPDLLASSKHLFDLVSVEGTVLAAVREATQDQYILESDGQLFSAIYRHPAAADGTQAAPPALKVIPLGSKVRVTGICMLTSSNPFDGKVPFDILMRDFEDIAVVARPPSLNVRNLSIAVGALLLAILAIGSWGWTLKSKVRVQTAALAARIEAEAALERRMAQLELRRSHILEDINGARPLAEIIEEVVDLESFRLSGAPCWCEIAGGARLGAYPVDTSSLRVVHREIPSRSGAVLGVLSAGFDPEAQADPDEQEALSMGTKLLALAIETRRLYADLHHRSEFDQLTDIHNRFSLEKYIGALIAESRDTAGVFGLIYIDLDQFKQVNDVYGHRVGDLYLQEVAERMKRQLRSADMLARLGGDEFAAVLPLVGNRAQADEIAHRLERSFDAPFSVSGHTLRGSASVGIALYPEDGTTKDSLLSAADAAMYVTKHTRKLDPALAAQEDSVETEDRA
ncbi:MAG TPA: GGDEF domain-containing protein [Terracidiphilus sp.]|nr:GGDEF domain-containing protein [Terracidiphilus sp.]